ncbi:MAG: WD40 repeat domain-containing protein, partial [Candidatus Helarchaeota archaeon]
MNDRNIYFFNRTSSIPRWNYTVGGDVHSMAISASGQFLVVSVRQENKIYFFQKNSSNPLWIYTNPSEITSVAISADGQYIAAGDESDNLFLFNRTSEIPLWSYSTGDSIESVSISADAQYIASGSRKNVYLFNLNGSGAKDNFNGDPIPGFNLDTLFLAIFLMMNLIFIQNILRKKRIE